MNNLLERFVSKETISDLSDIGLVFFLASLVYGIFLVWLFRPEAPKTKIINIKSHDCRGLFLNQFWDNVSDFQQKLCGEHWYSLFWRLTSFYFIFLFLTATETQFGRFSGNRGAHILY